MVPTSPDNRVSTVIGLCVVLFRGIFACNVKSAGRTQVIWKHLPNYSQNCTPLSPITITNIVIVMWIMHLSAAIFLGRGTHTGAWCGIWSLWSPKFRPRMGGLDCLCTFIARSHANNPKDSYCLYHIGDGAENTADRYDRYWDDLDCLISDENPARIGYLKPLVCRTDVCKTVTSMW